MKTIVFIICGILVAGIVYAATPTITTLNLNTKTLVNLPLTGKGNVEFSCYGSGTVTPHAVKFGLNSSVTNHLIKSSGEYATSPGFAKRFTFQPYSSATAVKCGILYR